MQLGKKKQIQSIQKSAQNSKEHYKENIPYDSRTMVLLLGAQIPNGKFKGRTLKYVMDNEDWYWQWMKDNNLITAWGLCKEKEPVKKKQIQYNSNQFDPFRASDGSIWLCLIEVPGTNNNTNTQIPY